VYRVALTQCSSELESAELRCIINLRQLNRSHREPAWYGIT
jgi:hypothetical protein